MARDIELAEYIVERLKQASVKQVGRAAKQLVACTPCDV